VTQAGLPPPPPPPPPPPSAAMLLGKEAMPPPPPQRISGAILKVGRKSHARARFFDVGAIQENFRPITGKGDLTHNCRVSEFHYILRSTGDPPEATQISNNVLVIFLVRREQSFDTTVVL